MPCVRRLLSQGNKVVNLGYDNDVSEQAHSNSEKPFLMLLGVFILYRLFLRSMAKRRRTSRRNQPLLESAGQTFSHHWKHLLCWCFRCYFLFDYFARRSYFA